MTGGPLRDEQRPIAYCAPGRFLTAVLALYLARRDYERIVETPAIEGADVILAAPFEGSPIPPNPVVCTDLPDRDWSFRYGALINRPLELGPVYL